MKLKSKYFVLSLFIVGVAAGSGFALNYFWQFASVAAAYKAKMMCSSVFISGREPQRIVSEDFSVAGLEPLRFVDAVVDKHNHAVIANVFGLVHRRAVFRPGLGCTLGYKQRNNSGAGNRDSSPALLSNSARPATDASVFKPASTTSALVHLRQQEIDNVFYNARLEAAVQWAFSEPDPENPRRTRAVVILYHGKIAAEKYAAGFTKDTPLIGWSLTKSVINALVGILVRRGQLDINKPAPVPLWQSAGDARRKITVNELMHMSSGLQFVENYKDTMSDVTRMLFDTHDAAAFAIGKPLLANPGNRWSYSSGSPVIICWIIRNIIGDKHYLNFPRQSLFDPLGMDSAVIETDATDTFLGSSFMYATPRDWARFGQLYLQDGVWNGKQVLPQGWIKYTTTAVANSPRQEYGSFFWLKLPKEFHSAGDKYLLPPDAFHAAGYDGQLISIIPSLKLVIVRMGLTRYPVIWPQDEFVKKIMDAVKR